MDLDLKSVMIYWTINSKFVTAYHAWRGSHRASLHLTLEVAWRFCKISNLTDKLTDFFTILYRNIVGRIITVGVKI